MNRFFAGFLGLALLTPAAMAEDTAVLLGSFKNWSAYSATIDGHQVCYALSEPRAKEPKAAKRDPIYFLVNDWPGRHAKAEAEIVPGYKYKDGVPVTVAIGGDKFTFFARNDGNEGSAWVQVLSDGPKMTEAMTHALSAVVTGTSARGTLTRDTYSLAGFDDALAKIHATCGM